MFSLITLEQLIYRNLLPEYEKMKEMADRMIEIKSTNSEYEIIYREFIEQVETKRNEGKLLIFDIKVKVQKLVEEYEEDSEEENVIRVGMFF